MQPATRTKKLKAESRKKKFSCLQPSTTRTQRAFTLLELLIVLFILGYQRKAGQSANSIS